MTGMTNNKTIIFFYTVLKMVINLLKFFFVQLERRALFQAVFPTSD